MKKQFRICFMAVNPVSALMSRELTLQSIIPTKVICDSIEDAEFALSKMLTEDELAKEYTYFVIPQYTKNS